MERQTVDDMLTETGLWTVSCGRNGRPVDAGVEIGKTATGVRRQGRRRGDVCETVKENAVDV